MKSHAASAAEANMLSAVSTTIITHTRLLVRKDHTVVTATEQAEQIDTIA
jgi:hypothetical protein